MKSYVQMGSHQGGMPQFVKQLYDPLKIQMTSKSNLRDWPHLTLRSISVCWSPRMSLHLPVWISNIFRPTLVIFTPLNPHPLDSMKLTPACSPLFLT